MDSFANVINRWDSLQAFADDVGVKYGTAQIWRYRNKIPSDYWEDVVRVADSRGYPGVTLELLTRLGAERSARKSRVSKAVREHAA